MSAFGDKYRKTGQVGVSSSGTTGGTSFGARYRKNNVPETYQQQQEIKPPTWSAPSANITIAEPAPKKESIWTKIAKVVLPKKLEDYFGLNKSATQEKVVEEYEQAYAYEDLRHLQEQLEAGGGKLPKETAGEAFKETPVTKYIPFVSAVPEIVEAVQIYQSAKRLEKGEETFVDLYRLTKYRSEAEQDQTFGAKITSLLTNLPSFGGELLLTGGIYTAGKKVVEKTIQETLERAIGKTAGRILTKTAANVVGGTLQTIPARGLEITAGTIQNMVPEYGFTQNELGELQTIITGEGDDLWAAAVKSLGDQWVEVVSEHSGGIFNEALAPVKNQLLKIGLVKAFLKVNPNAKVSDFMKWVKRAGWNGVIAEVGEEYIGAGMRGGLTQVGLSEEGWKFPSKEEFAVMLVGFSVPGAMIGVADKMMGVGGGQTIEGAPNEPTEGEPPTGGGKKPITSAEQIIGSRDLLIVGRGGTDLDANEVTILQQTINGYHEAVAEPAIEIIGTDKTVLTSIKTVQYPDGKWAYSIDINTAENGFFSDFLNGKLAATKAKAIAAAKTEVVDYAKSQLDSVSAETRAEFENIIKQVGEVKADKPVEVRQEEVEPTSKEEQLINTLQEKIMAGDMDYIERLREKAKSNPTLKSVLANAIATAQMRADKAKNKVVSEAVGKVTEGEVDEYVAAQNAAKDMIRSYVQRGDTIEDLKSGQMGISSPDGYSAKIGGFINGKRISADKIIVDRLEGKDLKTPLAFSLQKIYDEIKAEAPTQKEKVIEAVKEKPKTMSEGEFVEKLKKKYPDGVLLYHQTTQEGAKGIVKNGFNPDDTGAANFIIDKIMDRVSTDKGSAWVKITVPVEAYGRIFPHEKSYIDDIPEELSIDEGMPYMYAAMWTGDTIEGADADVQTDDIKQSWISKDIITRRGLKGTEYYGEYKEAAKEARGKLTPLESAIIGYKMDQGEKTEAVAEIIGLSKDDPIVQKSKDVLLPKLGQTIFRAGTEGISWTFDEDVAKGMGANIQERVFDEEMLGRTIFYDGLSEKELGFKWSDYQDLWKFRQEEEVLIMPKATLPPQIAKPKTKTKATPEYEIASKIIPKRPELPVLGTFQVKDGYMTVTDLEVSVRVKSALPDGIYKVVGKEAIKTDMDMAEFPIMPEVKGEPIFKATTDNLSKTLKSALLSVEKSELRPEITGVFMKIEGNKITVASTDAFRLFTKEMPGKVTGEGEFTISSPKKVQGVIEAIGEIGEVTTDGTTVRFSGENGEVVVRRVDGKFPEYKTIMPALNRQYLFDKKEWIAALKELKPFTGKGYGEGQIELKYADGKMTFTADSKAADGMPLHKEVVLDTREDKVDVKERSMNDGVIVMPIRDEAGGGRWLFNVNYLIDAANALDDGAIYFSVGKDLKERPALFSNEAKLKSEEVGTEKTILKGTKLYHGTNAEAASEIIAKGIKRTEDKTATYGKAVYLTPDYTSAQDYANEQDNGQVLTLKTNKELNLYQPTVAEREELVDKIGAGQDTLIQSMLGDKYDGLYIPDDGRGDGGEQVILYKSFPDEAADFEKAELADEIRTGVEKTVPPTAKKKRGVSGIASVGGDKLGNFEDLAGIENKTPEQMKIFEEVKALVLKYAKSIGEDYLPRNALGVYYPETTNVRIRGMNHLSVAAHEITHFLDFAYHISSQLSGVKGYSVTGNPIYEAETAKLRKEITDLYENYYPGAKHNHPLKKRLIEGFATLLEKYTEQPSTITAQYPNLVREFLTSEGKYYKPVMGDIIKDLREIIAKYQGLPALDKIGARVVSDKVNVNKDSFMGFWQKFKTFVADNIYPIEVLAKKAGVHFTKADPSLWVRQYNNSNAIILNNINGNRGYWGWRNSELIKLHDFNWKDLISDVHKTGVTNEFAYYLVARNQYFMYQELAELEEKGEPADDLKAILNNDGFTVAEVTDAYLTNKQRFAEFEKRFDTLVREDLNFLNDQSVGLVDNDDYKKITSREGYATMKRYFYDEVVGEEQVGLGRVRFGTTKVSSLIRRKGSQKPIINPLFASIKNHAEITRKGLKQIVYNKIGEIAMAKPEIGLFQKLQLKGIPDRQGHILFPQEKDPNIIMARLDYKRRPFLVDSTIKQTIDEVLNHQNLGIFEKLLMGSSRFFTKGTTGLFPGFALTNYTVDQVTAAAQTRNKYKVLYDPLTKIAQIMDNTRPEHAYLQEYLVMGGERQTFVGWQDMSPNELFDAIGKERAGLLKVVDGLNSGMSILAVPAQWSEILTRATEYIKARETGKPPIVALEEAGRVTAPFHHIGRWGGGRTGQVYIKSIPFFNPAIQVLSQAAETLETPEGRQRYGFVTLAITAASIGSLGLIMAYGSDDQKKLYADINPDELNKYIWLPSSDGKSLIKLRVPDQMAVFATAVNMMWADKALQANYTAGEYLNAGMSWLPQQLDVSQPARMFMAWIPQIIKPGVLTLAGVKDFPKIMPLESQMMTNRAPAFRYNEQTSPVAKWLGKTIGMSPIKIDYLLTGYLGRASGFLTGKPGIYNPLKTMSREYYFTSGRKVQSYYDLKEKNDQDYEAYKKKRKEYALGERTAILQLKEKLKVIEDVIGDYRDIDEEKRPDQARRLRDRILTLIDGLPQ